MLKSESTSVEAMGNKGTFTENGRVFENLDHIEFEKMDKLVNGIRLLSMCDVEDVVDDKELFKMKIASPVSVVSYIHLDLFVSLDGTPQLVRNV